MSAFNNLIERVALKEKLVKVQLKTDPAYSNLGNISKFQGYIGYILRENKISSKVFLEQNGAVIIVPNKMLEPVQNKLSKVDMFKLAALRYLKEKRDIKQTDTITKLIINCNSIEYVESFCIDNGCTQNDIKNIYKLAFNSTINESWWDVAKPWLKIATGHMPNKPWIPGAHDNSADNIMDLLGKKTSSKSGYQTPDAIKKYIKDTHDNSNGNATATPAQIKALTDEIANYANKKVCSNFNDGLTKIGTPITNDQLIQLYLQAAQLIY